MRAYLRTAESVQLIPRHKGTHINGHIEALYYTCTINKTAEQSVAESKYINHNVLLRKRIAQLRGMIMKHTLKRRY